MSKLFSKCVYLVFLGLKQPCFKSFRNSVCVKNLFKKFALSFWKFGHFFGDQKRVEKMKCCNFNVLEFHG